MVSTGRLQQPGPAGHGQAASLAQLHVPLAQPDQGLYVSVSGIGSGTHTFERAATPL